MPVQLRRLIPPRGAHRLILVGMMLWTALYYFAFEPVGLLHLHIDLHVRAARLLQSRPLVNQCRRRGWASRLWLMGSSPAFLQVALPQGRVRDLKRDGRQRARHSAWNWRSRSSPLICLYTLIGVFIGTMISHLPGIGPSAGIALLVPVTFGMDPTAALMMLAGIYYGCMYGGAVTAILIKHAPATRLAVMTTLDGYPLARQGRAGAAAGDCGHELLHCRHARGHGAHFLGRAARQSGAEVRAGGIFSP